MWVVCDPEDPEFGKLMEFGGRSSVSGDYGLANRNSGFFSVVKRRPLTTLPSLLSDSIHNLQKLKGTGDTVRKQVQAVHEPVKGLRERLVADPTEGEQTGPPLKRTYELFGSLLTSMDSGGKNGSKSAERSSHTFDDGWSEYHDGSDAMASLSQFFKV